MARASGKVPIHLPVALPETLTPFPPWCGWVRLGAAKKRGRVLETWVRLGAALDFWGKKG